MGTGSGTKISRYECERRDPTLDTVLTLEAIFGVSVRELFAGRFHEVERSVMERARLLIEALRLKAPNPALTAKLQALTAICSKFITD